MKRSDIVSPQGSVTPIEETHPAVGQHCVVCHEAFVVGSVPSVVLIRNRGSVSLDIAHEHCAYEEN